MSRTHPFLTAKYKHMIKSGAPLTKFGFLPRLLPREFHQAELISKGYYSLVPGLISIFLETVWVPLINARRT